MAERIAVIAIHGVGDHLPFDMARDIGNLLENLRDPVNVSAKDAPGKPRYCTFGQSTIRLNVAPVKVLDHAADVMNRTAAPGTRTGKEGLLDCLIDTRSTVNRASESSSESVDHLFMEGQLKDYVGEGPGDTYELLRLEGNRYQDAPVGPQFQQSQPPGGAKERTPGKQVHIYDMFWSDLSGVKTTGLRIFGELYQVLFHLGSIGVNNVKAAAVVAQKGDAGTAARWKNFGTAQKNTTDILTLPLPVLNLILVAVALTLFAVAALRRLNVKAELVAVAGLLLAIAAAGCGFLVFRKGGFKIATFTAPLAAASLLFAGISLATLNVPFAVAPAREAAELVAAVLILLALMAGVWFVIGQYGLLKPDAPGYFKPILIFWAAAFLIVAFVPPPKSTYLAMQLLLRAMEAGFWLLTVYWLLFWGSLFRAFFSGWSAVKATKKTSPDEWERARGTNWTARITVALPALLLVLLTFAFWTGMIKAGIHLLPHDSCNASLPSDPERNKSECNAQALCFSSHFPDGKPEQPIRYWADDTLSLLGGLSLPLLLLVAAIAGIMALWGVVPSVLAESLPPRGSLDELKAEAQPMGDWLTEGFRFMRWAGRLIYAAIFLFTPFSVVSAAMKVLKLPLYDAIEKVATPTAHILGVLVAGAALGVFGFGGQLSKLALGLRPLVRVALDVDNWLREHPLKSNPTARICGRYVSLLRYICQWRNQENKGYDALVIFAHSQGSVITADLLRFLTAEAKHASEKAKKATTYAAYDETLTELDGNIMPIYLFTMGCPLRQLYALRFPYLYDYVGTGASPAPKDLGVRQWVNAYRTGDYVGRYLWRDNPWLPVADFSTGVWDPAAGIPANVFHKDDRVEFSIGPGAHTHYWDSTAAPIAQMLDVLIAHA